MFKKVALICLSCTLTIMFVFSQEKAAVKLQAGNYLVVGAYSKNKKHLADQYAKTLSDKGYSASVDYFPRKNYHFVYLNYYEDFNASIRGLYQHRKIELFSDCWVHVMRQAEIIDKARDKQVSSLSDMFASRFGPSDQEISDSTKVEEEDDNKLSINNELNEERIVLETETIKLAPNKEDTTTEEPLEKNAMALYLSLFDARSSVEIAGKIEVIDGVNHSKIGEVEGNKLIHFNDPDNGTGNLVLISNVFGFKRQQLDFNYHEPLDNEEMPYVTNIGDTIVVNFELQRYNKGDVMVMYNVFFFKDAAIMKPESKFELAQLVSLLKERPNVKIRIHGHTNGNAPGLIKHYNPESKNYFSLDEVTKETTGSAKKLSEYRALIIKHYLMDSGIAEKRMETKAWGGKDMIHDKHDTQAKRNVRVEIEYLTD